MVMVCPTCAGEVTELLWIYQQKYYCSQKCVPGTPEWLAVHRPHLTRTVRDGSQ